MSEEFNKLYKAFIACDVNNDALLESNMLEFFNAFVAFVAKHSENSAGKAKDGGDDARNAMAEIAEKMDDKSLGLIYGDFKNLKATLQRYQRISEYMFEYLAQGNFSKNNNNQIVDVQIDDVDEILKEGEYRGLLSGFQSFLNLLIYTKAELRVKLKCELYKLKKRMEKELQTLYCSSGLNKNKSIGLSEDDKRILRPLLKEYEELSNALSGKDRYDVFSTFSCESVIEKTEEYIKSLLATSNKPNIPMKSQTSIEDVILTFRYKMDKRAVFNLLKERIDRFYRYHLILKQRQGLTDGLSDELYEHITSLLSFLPKDFISLKEGLITPNHAECGFDLDEKILNCSAMKVDEKKYSIPYHRELEIKGVEEKEVSSFIQQAYLDHRVTDKKAEPLPLYAICYGSFQESWLLPSSFNALNVLNERIERFYRYYLVLKTRREVNDNLSEELYEHIISLLSFLPKGFISIEKGMITVNAMEKGFELDLNILNSPAMKVNEEKYSKPYLSELESKGKNEEDINQDIKERYTARVAESIKNNKIETHKIETDSVEPHPEYPEYNKEEDIKAKSLPLYAICYDCFKNRLPSLSPQKIPEERQENELAKQPQPTLFPPSGEKNNKNLRKASAIALGVLLGGAGLLVLTALLAVSMVLSIHLSPLLFIPAVGITFFCKRYKSNYSGSILGAVVPPPPLSLPMQPTN